MKKILIPIMIILCLICGGYYISTNIDDDIFYSSKFPANTVVNGIDCSKMTISEVSDALTDEWNSHYVTFKNETGILGSIKLTGVTYDIENQLKNIRKDYFASTIMNHVFGTQLNLTVHMNLDECGDKFNESLKKAEYLKEKDIIETENAYIALDDPELPIIEEVYGNSIDYDSLKKELFTLVADGTFGFHYVKSEFYEQPSITADSEELLKRQEFYKENLTSDITYTLGKDTVTISPEQMAKFYKVKISENGPLTDKEIKLMKKAVSDKNFSEKAIRKFIYQFACDYNTLGSTRSFTTTDNRKIKIAGGDYGFAVDQDAEYEQLLDDLTSGKPVKRDPVWSMTGFTDYCIGNDIGDTYVEISIKDQHLWYYKNGKKIVECDVVTGNPYMGYSTPTGTFGLSYKQYGATLRGEEADGTEYESPVTYWMPFYGNYGMHDATWRYYFGDQIYLGGGSHGCVNMPLKAAGKVFENIADRNVPVIVYNK